MAQAAQSIDRDASVQAFNRSILDQLDHVEYRLISGGEDLEDIYRLRYDSFLRAGMLESDPSGMLQDRWDDLPNSYRFAVYYDGELMSTMRINYVSSACPSSPASDTFPEVMTERVARGETFVDVSRFAAYENVGPSPLSVPFLTMRLVTVATSYFRQTGCLYAIKPEHTAFYKRMFSASCVAGPKPFPGLVVPRFLYETPCGDNLPRVLARYPFMHSTKSEQRMLFGSLERGEAPLTILPTAKYASMAA